MLVMICDHHITLDSQFQRKQRSDTKATSTNSIQVTHGLQNYEIGFLSRQSFALLFSPFFQLPQNTEKMSHTQSSDSRTVVAVWFHE